MYQRALTATLSDTISQPGGVCSAFMITGAAANVSLLMVDDAVSIVIPVLPGVVYPFNVKRFNLTSTTATSVVALYR